MPRCFFALISLFVLTACASEQSGAQVEPPRLAATATDTEITSIRTPTLDAVVSPTSTRNPEYEGVNATQTALAAARPTLTASPEPTTTVTPTSTLQTLSKLPAPMLLEDRANRLWLMDTNSETELIAENVAESGFDVSPDGNYVIYSSEYDIWLVDLVTREVRNITQTPDAEFDVQWWPGRNGFATESCVQTSPDEWSDCRLIYFDLDGTSQVVDENVYVGAFAVSADGSSIAYTGCAQDCDPDDQFWIMREGQSPIRFSLTELGFTNVWYIADISISPDADQLGLVLTYPVEDGALNSQEQVVVIELEDLTSRILHEFMKTNTGVDIESAPVWAPTGDWFVFWTSEWVLVKTYQPEYVLWFADDTSVRRLTPAEAGIPAISPDGQWIATTAEDSITFRQVSDGTVFTFPLNQTLSRIAWVSLP